MDYLAPSLISARIQNYKSLSDVKLYFKGLTILVGANSSGKSNCLESLNLLRLIVKNGSAPPAKILESMQKVGVDEDITLSVTVQDKKQAEYCISVKTDIEDAEDYFEDAHIAKEILTIGKTKVIDLVNGVGTVRDENRRNTQNYRSKPDKLALTSAGNFGEKPVTANVAEFIQNWEFYDLDPDYMRGTITSRLEERARDDKPILSLDAVGRRVQGLLKYWAREEEEKFSQVNEELYSCMKIQLKLVTQEDSHLLKVVEQDSSEIPFSNLSDGTLRIIAYCTLLHTPEGPTLIGIEEPERNLHPGILKDVAAIIKRLSQKMQVVITTHSSQLLDCFSLEDINSDVSVILLKKGEQFGTEAFLIDDLSRKREDFMEWMVDFGVGSAIYHSNLLQEMMVA